MPDPIELAATILCECIHDEPVRADLTVGDDVLRVESEDRSLAVAAAAIFDVRLGSSPRAATEFFSGAVLTVGFERDGRRDVLFVDGSRSALEKYAGLLYRWLLDGTEVAVRHPAEVGGRVTGETFDIGTLRVTPGKVGCTGITYSFGIDLDTIVHLSRSEGELLGDERTMIDLQYVSDGMAVSLDLSVEPPRTRHLLGRHLRQEYHDVRKQVRQLDLPGPAVRTLHKLYSLRGTASASELLDGSTDASVDILRGLGKADLVCLTDEGVELTSRGWILVTEHVGTSDGEASAPPADD